LSDPAIEDATLEAIELVTSVGRLRNFIDCQNYFISESLDQQFLE
jgi:hypothetical protein